MGVVDHAHNQQTTDLDSLRYACRDGDIAFVRRCTGDSIVFERAVEHGRYGQEWHGGTRGNDVERGAKRHRKYHGEQYERGVWGDYRPKPSRRRLRGSAGGNLDDYAFRVLWVQDGIRPDSFALRELHDSGLEWSAEQYGVDGFGG